MPRDGKIRRLLGNRRLMAALGAGIVVVGVAGFLWFRPDKLFVDEGVDEAVPMSMPDAAEDVDASPDDPEAMVDQGPRTVARGGFESHNRYTTSGRALVLELDDAARVVRFENFKTSNGPDLRVYLSNAEPGEQSRALADDFVDLGPLKGNVGNQNYEVPEGTDLDRYSTVVVWCVRFTVSFGAAELR